MTLSNTKEVKLSKFTNKTRKLTDTKLVKSVRLYEDEWLEAKKIHPKFSAFARRAVLEKIERDGNMNLESTNKQAAKDYDMDIVDVERIRKLYPNQFYEMLEEFIEARANRE